MFTKEFTLIMILIFVVIGATGIMKRKSCRLVGIKICPWKLIAASLSAFALGIFFGPY